MAKIRRKKYLRAKLFFNKQMQHFFLYLGFIFLCKAQIILLKSSKMELLPNKKNLKSNFVIFLLIFHTFNKLS